nr:hypothetical protein [Gammaproteobacteria bacterium]
MLNQPPSPVELHWLQDRLVAPSIQIDIVDLMHELERTPDDRELHDLYNHYA